MASEIERQLRAAGNKRARAAAKLEESMGEVRRLVVKADGELPRSQIAELAGVTRASVYSWLKT